MSEDELSPLPPDVVAMLDAERRSPDPPPEALARVRARLGVTARTSHHAEGRSRRVFVVQVAALMLVTLAVGIAAGFGLRVWVFDGPDPAGDKFERLPRPQTPVRPRHAPAVRQAQPPPAVAPAPLRSSAHRPSAPRDREAATLARESALLQQARARLERGDGRGAFEVLAGHAREFPHGLLVEEREALVVKALVMAKNRFAAHARADEFRRNFPRSIYRPVVEAALESP